MTTLSKKLFVFLLLIFITWVIFAGITTFAEEKPYTLLEPELFMDNEISSSGEIKPSEYFGKMYNFGLSAVIILALVSLVIAGVQYTARGISEAAKTDAKTRISMALGGLLLALFSYLILNTINPDFVNPKIEIGPLAKDPTVYLGSSNVPPSKGECLRAWKNLGVLYKGVAPEDVKKGSPKLSTFVARVKERVRENFNVGDATNVLGSIYTYEESNPYCNMTRGYPNANCGVTSCQHSPKSKHYGLFVLKKERPEYYGSNAVDFGMGVDNTIQKHGDSVIQIAKEVAQEIGVENFRIFCEREGKDVGCSGGQADHIHAEMWPNNIFRKSDPTTNPNNFRGSGGRGF